MTPSPSSPIKVLLLSGPTGIGKTALATVLCHLLNGEIISCDSVQVYKELNIGSNKERHIGVPQHMIDLVSWKQPFSAGDYYDQCVALIREIHQRGKVPLVVGGTGFYMSWLLHGKPQGPPTTPEVMTRVNDSLKGKSWTEALAMLRQVDPEYADTIVPNDFYRIQRALAIHIMTGRPLSAYRPSEGPGLDPSGRQSRYIFEIWVPYPQPKDTFPPTWVFFLIRRPQL